MKKNEFIEGAFIATLAIVISKCLGLLYVIPFHSIIGESGGALYGYAYNIYNFFLIISTAGIPLAISKLTSEYNALKLDKQKTYMFNYSKKVIGIFSIIAFLICFFGSGFIANLIVGDLTNGNSVEDVSLVIKCVSFSILIVPVLSISRGYMQGHKFIAAPAFGQVIEQLVRVIVIVLGSYISLRVLGSTVPQAVGVALLGSCLGGVISYLYLYSKMRKVKDDIFVKEVKVTKEERKSILKKLIGYCIPFIIINVANSVYNSIDMILVIRGLNHLGYAAKDIETISSVFTTWGCKLVSIVTSIATGLVISLIPSIVDAYTKKNMDEVNIYFNKTLQVLLYLILPLSIFLSIFSKQVWTIFYGKSFYGPLIFKYTILLAVLDSAYIMICSALQGLSKTKLIYTACGVGLVTKTILDLPLMYLFDKLGIYPFYGAILATTIGYILSLAIPLCVLKKKYKFDYSKTIKTIPKLLLNIFILVIICLLVRKLIVNITNRLLLLALLAIIGLSCLFIYYFLNKKLLNDLIGDKLLKLKKKKK